MKFKKLKKKLKTFDKGGDILKITVSDDTHTYHSNDEIPSRYDNCKVEEIDLINRNISLSTSKKHKFKERSVDNDFTTTTDEIQKVINSLKKGDDMTLPNAHVMTTGNRNIPHHPKAHSKERTSSEQKKTSTTDNA